MALMGLMMAVALVSLQGPYREARSKHAIERLAHYESQARRYALRTGKSFILEIDTEKSQLAMRSLRGSEAQLSPLYTESGLRIERALFATASGPQSLSKIPVSPRGRTPSYALKIHLVDGGDTWLLFAGVSGQMTRIENESDVRELLQQEITLSRVYPD